MFSNRYLLTAILSILRLTGYSQKFEFPNKNGVWYIEYLDPSGFSIYNQSVSSDTTINEKNYSIITSAYGWDTCAIRSDSVKTYAIDLHVEKQEEYVLYDWTLKAGDKWVITPKNECYFDSVVFDVINVDSILIAGEYRKRIELDDHTMNRQYWIEGIGSTVSPLYHYHIIEFEQVWKLHGYRENGNCLWGNCPTAVTNLVDKNSIFYNHQEKCLYSLDIKEPIPINIYNCMGQYIKSFSVEANQRIDLSYFNKGNYLLSWCINKQPCSLKICIH